MKWIIYKSNMNWKHPATYHGLTRTNHSLHLVTLMLSRSCNRLTTIRTIMKLLTNHCYRVSVYKSSYLSLYKYHNTMNYKLMWLSNGLIKPYFKPLSSPSHQFVSTGDHWSDEWKFLIRVPKKYWEPSAQAMAHPQPARPPPLLIFILFFKANMIVYIRITIIRFTQWCNIYTFMYTCICGRLRRPSLAEWANI